VSIVVWMTVGIVLGLLASQLGRMDETGSLFNLAIGLFGGGLGGWLFSGIAGASEITPHDFSVGSLLGSLLAATTLLIVARLARVTG
jgi:uncharacterized membrane protein YeaQ/YmgE (transglycosylase-associated protein family)